MPTPSKKQRFLMPILIILGIIVADQIAKGTLLYLINGSVPLGANAFDLVPFPYMIVRAAVFFNVVFTWNPGTSFSLFQSLGVAAPIVLIALSAVIIGALGYYLFSRAKSHERAALSFIVGGAFGNLIDRLRFGAVIDFLDFHVETWHWPAFNIADICIFIGVALYVIHWVFVTNKEKGK